MAGRKSRADLPGPDSTSGAASLQELFEALPIEGTGADADDVVFASTATLVIRSARVISARIDEVVGPLGLTVPKFEVLAFLHAAPAGELRFAELKARMFMHPATMGHTIRLLEADGLVRRRGHESDRRAFIAVLTARGRSVTAKGLAAVRQIDFGCEGLSVTAARVVNSRLTLLG